MWCHSHALWLEFHWRCSPVIMFHRRVWHRPLSLCYACIRHSSIILISQATLIPNFISFADSIAALAHEKIAYSITHSLTHTAYLMSRELKLVLRIQVRYYNSQQLYKVYLVFYRAQSGNYARMLNDNDTSVIKINFNEYSWTLLTKHFQECLAVSKYQNSLDYWLKVSCLTLSFPHFSDCGKNDSTKSFRAILI